MQENYWTRLPFNRRQSTCKQDTRALFCSCDADPDRMALMYKLT